MPRFSSTVPRCSSSVPRFRSSVPQDPTWILPQVVRGPRYQAVEPGSVHDTLAKLLREATVEANTEQTASASPGLLV